MRSTSGEEVQTTAPENVLRELANALEQTGRAMPAIRKACLSAGESWPEGMYVSVYDVIRAIKDCNQQDAAKEYKRLCDTYGDRWAICPPVNFADSRGRVDPNRKTPVANAPTIVRLIFYLPGQMAKRVVVQASEIFVRFLGGDVSLVQEVMRNRQLQDTLREKDRDHWARLFGEYVEASAGSAPPPVPQRELVQKACEAVVQAAIRREGIRTAWRHIWGLLCNLHNSQFRRFPGPQEQAIAEAATRNSCVHVGYLALSNSS